MREEWTYKKFGDVASFSRGLTYSKSDVAEESYNKVLRSNNIDLDTHLLNFDDVVCLKEDFMIPADKKFKKNDIFICMSNGSTKHLGKVAFIEKEIDYAFGGFMGAIHPKVEEVYPKFTFYYCLSSEYRRSLASVLNGININNIKWSDLSKFPIPIPPLAEQERIVAELDLLSSIIEKKKAQLKEFDQLAQSIFYDMFGDPITNEKGWETTTIGECCVLKSGNSDANNSSIGLLPYVKVGDMNIVGNETYINTSSTFVDREENIKNILPIGTTIFPKRGGAILTNKKRITNVEICCDLNVMGVIPNKEKLNPLYIYFYFLKLDFSIFGKTGSTIPQINNHNIAPMKIALPPLPLQQEFAEKVEAIELQKSLIQQSIDEVQTLFDSRMDYWFG